MLCTMLLLVQHAWPLPCSPAGPANTFNGLPPAAPPAVPATQQQAWAVWMRAWPPEGPALQCSGMMDL